MGKSVIPGQPPGIKACTGGFSTDSRSMLLKARTVIAAYVAEQDAAAEKKANNKRLLKKGRVVVLHRKKRSLRPKFH